MSGLFTPDTEGSSSLFTAYLLHNFLAALTYHVSLRHEALTYNSIKKYEVGVELLIC